MIVLTLLSRLYHWGVCFRHYLYDKKILKKKIASLPVVSIGNVVAGGAGKTQAALMLAEQLSEEIRVAILTRGYKGKAENAKEPLHVDIGRHSALFCGDEPWLLASRLASSFILVNKNRFKSAQKARELGAEVLVLDDGMQHRELHRDFEIVIIDGKTPFGPFLPKGTLREDLKRLKNADLILFVGTPLEEIEKAVALQTAAPQVIVKIAESGLFSLDGKEVGALSGKEVGVFCGIGDPARFVRTVQELGAHVVATHFSKDHHIMEEKNLRKFASFAKEKGAKLLICTEKDKVKLACTDFSLPIVWLRTTLQIVGNQMAWSKLVNEIKSFARVGGECR